MDDDRYHRERRAAILRERPAVRALYGNSKGVAAAAAAVVVGQLILAAALAQQPWWVIVLAAIGIGAFATHFLNVVIHECSHNLVFRTPDLNRACAILANLPAVLPSAMAFRHYHLLHHRFLGRRGLDADATMAWEVRLVGHGRVRKALWLLAQPLFYGFIHPAQVRRPPALDRWLVANFIVVPTVAGAMVFAFGWPTLLYLLLSTYFAIGPHPTGAHTIQEHFDIRGSGETASYYGPVNAISLNHGLHLEHHDFPNVPGWRLRKLRQLAPEFYAGRFHYRSRLLSLWNFVFDRNVALDRRAFRVERSGPAEA